VLFMGGGPRGMLALRPGCLVAHSLLLLLVCPYHHLLAASCILLPRS